MPALDPPRRRAAILFHGALTIALACLGWAFSGPVPDLGWLAGTGPVLVALVLVWLAFFRSRVRTRAWSWPAPTPLLVVAAAVLIAVGLPAHLRWAAGRPAFDRAVATLTAARQPPTRIGSYRVTDTTAVPGGYVFTIAGRWLGDAGFAYLSQGPTSGLTDSQGFVFVHLDGPWYSWTASQ